MPVRKEQKIAILVENSETDKNLILHGIKLAATFKKELCFVSLHDSNKEYNNEAIAQALQGYCQVVKKDIPALQVSKLILKGNRANLIDILTDEHEVILFITRSAIFKKWGKTVRVSQVPFLFVDTATAPLQDYKKIIIPVDLRKESQDAILWASYFARFNQSGINALAANDKAKDDIKDVRKNIISMKKLFAKFNLGLRIFKGSSNSLKIQFEALELAKKSGADMVIMLGSSYISFIDLLIGLPEKKIIKSAGKMPVLLINPRKDMYIMCD